MPRSRRASKEDQSFRLRPNTFHRLNAFSRSTGVNRLHAVGASVSLYSTYLFMLADSNGSPLTRDEMSLSEESGRWVTLAAPGGLGAVRTTHRGVAARMQEGAAVSNELFIESAVAWALQREQSVSAIVNYTKGIKQHLAETGESFWGGHAQADLAEVLQGLIALEPTLRGEVSANSPVSDEVKSNVAEVDHLEEVDLPLGDAEPDALVVPEPEAAPVARPASAASPPAIETQKEQEERFKTYGAGVTLPMPMELRLRLGSPMRSMARLLVNDFLLHDLKALDGLVVADIDLPPVPELVRARGDNTTSFFLDDNVAPTLDRALGEISDLEGSTEGGRSHARGPMVTRILLYKFAQIDSGERTLAQMEENTHLKLRHLQRSAGEGFVTADTGRFHRDVELESGRVAPITNLGEACRRLRRELREAAFFQASSKRAQVRVNGLLSAKDDVQAGLLKALATDSATHPGALYLALDEAAASELAVERLASTGSSDPVKRSANAAAYALRAQDAAASARQDVVRSLGIDESNGPVDDAAFALALSDVMATRWPTGPSEGDSMREYVSVKGLIDELSHHRTPDNRTPAAKSASLA